MKAHFWMGIMALLMSIAMIVCIVFDIIFANWLALIVCVIALFLNGGNAIACFRRYRTMKNMEKLHPTAGILSSGGFMSD